MFGNYNLQKKIPDKLRIYMDLPDGATITTNELRKYFENLDYPKMNSSEWQKLKDLFGDDIYKKLDEWYNYRSDSLLKLMGHPVACRAEDMLEGVNSIETK